MGKVRSVLFAAVAAVVSVSSAVAADTIEWTGGGDGTSWSDPKNWGLESGYPEGDVHVSFSNDATVTLDTGKETSILMITAQAGKTVTLNATEGSSFYFGLLVNGENGPHAKNGAKIYFNAPVSGSKNRIDPEAAGPSGELHFRSAWRNIRNTIYMTGYGKFYFEDGCDIDSKTTSRDIYFAHVSNSTNKMGYAWMTGDAKITCRSLYIGSNSACPSFDFTQDGADTLLQVGTVTVGGASRVINPVERYIMKAGTVDALNISIACNNVGYFVQEGGTVKTGSVKLGIDANSSDYKVSEFAGAYELNGGVLDVLYGGEVLTGDSTGKKVPLRISGGTIKLGPSTTSSMPKTKVPLQFSGTSTIEIGSKNFAFETSPVIAPDAVLHKTGAGDLYLENVFVGAGELDIDEGLVQLSKDNNTNIRSRIDPAPDGSNWKVKVANGATFRIGSAHAYVNAPLDLELSDGAKLDLAVGRIGLYARSCVTNGVKLAAAKYAGIADSNWIGSKTSYLLVTRNWTGAGDGTSFEDGANWEDGVVPNSNSLPIDLSDATTVVLTKDRQVNCVKACPRNGGMVTVTDNGAGFYLFPYSADYAPGVQVGAGCELVLDCLFYTRGSTQICGYGRVTCRRNAFGTSSAASTASEYTPICCLDGVLSFSGCTVFRPYGATAALAMAFFANQGNSRAEVLFENGCGLEFDTLEFSRNGFTAVDRIVQRESDLTLRLLNVCNHHNGDSAAPFAYVLESGNLTVTEGVFLNNPACTRDQGLNSKFVMEGGTLTTPKMSSSNMQNYYRLRGGEVNLGAGGVVKHDPSKPAVATRNTAPGFDLCGVTLRATDSFAVTLDTVFSSSGTDATTIEVPEGMTVSFDCPVTGTGAWRKTGAGEVVFTGAQTFAGRMTVEGGTVTYSDAATLTALPKALDLASVSSLALPAGTEVTVDSLTIGGVPQTGAVSFGEATVTVAPGASVNRFIGPSGAKWSAAGNWSVAVPDGADDEIDFAASHLGDGFAIDLDADVTLKTLAFDGEGTLTIGGAGSLTFSEKSTLRVARGCTLVFDAEVVLGTDSLTNSLAIHGPGRVVFRKGFERFDHEYKINDGGRVDYSDAAEVELQSREWGIYGVLESISSFSADPVRYIVRDGGLRIVASSPFANHTAGSFAIEQDGGTVSYTNSLQLTTKATSGTVGATGHVFRHAMTDGTLLIPGGVWLSPGIGDVLFTLAGGTVETNGRGEPFMQLMPVELAGEVSLKQGAADDFSAFDMLVTGAGGFVQCGPGTARLTGSLGAVTTLAVQDGALAIDAATSATNLTVATGAAAAFGVADALSADAEVSLGKTSVLDLGYEGTMTVKSLTINGKPRKKGLYSAESAPSLRDASHFTGEGVLQVLEGEAPGVILIVR